MRKIWFLIVGFFAVLSLLVGCGAERGVGDAPVTQESVQASNELAEKQAELDQLKLEKLEADKKELEDELAEKKAAEEAIQLREAKKTRAADIEESFLESIREEVPKMKSVDNSKLVELGELICKKISSGTSAVTLVNVTMESGYTQNESTSIVGVSIGSYCPEELDNLS